MDKEDDEVVGDVVVVVDETLTGGEETEWPERKVVMTEETSDVGGVSKELTVVVTAVWPNVMTAAGPVVETETGAGTAIVEELGGESALETMGSTAVVVLVVPVTQVGLTLYTVHL